MPQVDISIYALCFFEWNLASTSYKGPRDVLLFNIWTKRISTSISNYHYAPLQQSICVVRFLLLLWTANFLASIVDRADNQN